MILNDDLLTEIIIGYNKTIKQMIQLSDK